MADSFPQFSQRPQPQHTDCPNAAVHSPSNFFVRQIFKISQHQHLAIVWWQFIERLGQLQ